jgi:hypothetical protein
VGLIGAIKNKLPPISVHFHERWIISTYSAHMTFIPKIKLVVLIKEARPVDLEIHLLHVASNAVRLASAGIPVSIKKVYI